MRILVGFAPLTPIPLLPRRGFPNTARLEYTHWCNRMLLFVTIVEGRNLPGDWFQPRLGHVATAYARVPMVKVGKRSVYTLCITSVAKRSSASLGGVNGFEVPPVMAYLYGFRGVKCHNET